MSRVDVEGQTVLVTGAARGIGEAAARHLHAKGANVALVGLEPERMEALAGQLGDRVSVHPADVTDSVRLAEVADEVATRFGGIDVSIANAGIATVGSIADAPLADLERTLEVNLAGVIRTTRAVLPHVTARRGYLLTVASAAAASHAPLMGPYAASKAGVEAFTNVLRIELRPGGTAVGCAYFGWIDTDMVRESLANPGGQALHSMLPGPLGRSLSVDAAARTIIDSVERRAARAWAPWHVGPSLALRGVLQPLSELGLASRPGAVRRMLELARGG